MSRASSRTTSSSPIGQGNSILILKRFLQYRNTKENKTFRVGPSRFSHRGGSPPRPGGACNGQSRIVRLVTGADRPATIPNRQTREPQIMETRSPGCRKEKDQEGCAEKGGQTQ